MLGRAGRAPCGCPGEYVIGQYVRCLKGCDAKRISICPKCKSTEVEHWPFAQQYFQGDDLAMRCLPCGCVWQGDSFLEIEDDETDWSDIDLEDDDPP